MKRRGYGPLVVVVGAGAAGLAAASMLEDRHLDVVVLESRDRIGGRVWTVREWTRADGGQVPIDVGASWIHGTMGNPVTELRDAFEIETTPTDVTDISLHWQGTLIDAQTTRELHETAEKVIEEIDHPTRRGTHHQLAPIVASALGKQDLEGRDLAAVRFYLWEHIQNEWASDPDRLSAAWYMDTRFEGQQEVFPGGYDRIFHNLAGPMLVGITAASEEKPATEEVVMEEVAQRLDVRTGRAVTEIRYGRDSVTVVAGANGEVVADYVIVTLPLGVLKRGSVRFSPPLPAPKWAAINRLGMGVLSKTWLKFPEVFWQAKEGPSRRIHACLRPGTEKWSSW